MFDFLLRDAAQREGQWLELGGEKVWLAWKRHATAKRLKLLVSADGPRLTLPVRASQKSALAFVAEHHAWILAQWPPPLPKSLAPLVNRPNATVPFFRRGSSPLRPGGKNPHQYHI